MCLFLDCSVAFKMCHWEKVFRNLLVHWNIGQGESMFSCQWQNGYGNSTDAYSVSFPLSPSLLPSFYQSLYQYAPLSHFLWWSAISVEERTSLSLSHKTTVKVAPTQSTENDMQAGTSSLNILKYKWRKCEWAFKGQHLNNKWRIKFKVSASHVIYILTLTLLTFIFASNNSMGKNSNFMCGSNSNRSSINQSNTIVSSICRMTCTLSYFENSYCI